MLTLLLALACVMPKEEGTYSGALGQSKYYYNSATNNCEQFTFNGAGGNANNFENKDQCESYCKTGQCMEYKCSLICILIKLLAFKHAREGDQIILLKFKIHIRSSTQYPLVQAHKRRHAIRTIFAMQHQRALLVRIVARRRVRVLFISHSLTTFRKVHVSAFICTSTTGGVALLPDDVGPNLPLPELLPNPGKATAGIPPRIR